MALPFITANQAEKLKKEVEILKEEVEETPSAGGTFLLDFTEPLQCISVDNPIKALTSDGDLYEIVNIDGLKLQEAIENGTLIMCKYNWNYGPAVMPCYEVSAVNAQYTILEEDNCYFIYFMKWVVTLVLQDDDKHSLEITKYALKLDKSDHKVYIKAMEPSE